MLLANGGRTYLSCLVFIHNLVLNDFVMGCALYKFCILSSVHIASKIYGVSLLLHYPSILSLDVNQSIANSRLTSNVD